MHKRAASCARRVAHNHKHNHTASFSEFLFDCFHANRQNKIFGFTDNTSDGVYQHYFGSLVADCEEFGKVDYLYDEVSHELIGCALSVPFSECRHTSDQWTNFYEKAQRDGLQDIHTSIEELDEHIQQQVIAVSDKNSFDEEHDVHMLKYIAIHPKHQGQGHGTQLLKHVAEHYKDSGSALLLHTSNPRMDHWFRNLDFKPELSSSFGDQTIGWHSVPPILHGYWNY